MEGNNVQVNPDGTVIYRASALGGCTQALLAARLEYEPLPPPPKVAALFRSGHEAEVEVLKRLPHILGRQDVVELTVTSRVSVRGHVDGVDPKIPSVVEIKSQGQDAWDTYEREGMEGGLFPKYQWQFSTYMLALSMPLTLIRYNRDTREMAREEFSEPFYSLAQIRSRVLEVEKLARYGVMKDCDSRDWPCPYFYLHTEADPDRELVRDYDVEIVARQYDDARQAENVAKDKKDKSRSGLRGMLKGDKNVTESGVKITFSEVSKLLPPLPPPPVDKTDEFNLELTWEQMRVTMPRKEQDDE